MTSYVQLRHPITNLYVRVNTRTGQIVGRRKKPYSCPIRVHENLYDTNEHITELGEQLEKDLRRKSIYRVLDEWSFRVPHHELFHHLVTNINYKLALLNIAKEQDG
jgi:hypothetical protein